MRKAPVFAAGVAVVLAWGIGIWATDPLLYGPTNLDPVKLYNSDSGSERVDLFRGSLHIEQTDVHLPGKYGLDVNVVRWYDSKLTDATWYVAPNYYVYDYGTERGEVLGYGWRLHMGRFYMQQNPYIPPTGDTSNPNPADFLELPGGKRISFVTSSDNALFPGSNPSGQRMGSEFWRAVYPATTSDPVVVYAPDGTKYTFGAGTRYSDGTGYTVYSVTEIRRGDAAIQIDYSTDAQYSYISKITDTYGRTVTFSYYNDGYTQVVNALYQITLPVANGTNYVKYYYISQASAAQTTPRVDNPTFTTPTVNGTLSAPTPRTTTGSPSGQTYFILGKVTPPAGDSFATWYQYFLDNNSGKSLNTAFGAGNLMEGIRFPNGTVTAYEYKFISRTDFPGTSGYLVLNRRGKSGKTPANFSSASAIRKWQYTYSFVGTGPGDTQGQWKVQVDAPEPVRQVYYFNPFLPIDSGTLGSGNLQRWRVGLLLKSETRDSSTQSAPVVEDTAYTYTKVSYDSYRYPWVSPANSYAEHGYMAVLSSKSQTLHFSSGDLAKTTTYSGFDQYGNPGEKIENDYLGQTLRRTSITYAWATDTSGALKNKWVIQAPDTTTVEDGSGTTLSDTSLDYYSDSAHTGLLSQSRTWVSDDGTSSSYWSGEDYDYTSSGNQDTVTTSAGHTTSRNGSLTVVRKIVEKKDRGTPLSKVVQDQSGSSSITVFSRTLDTNGLAPMSETVDGTTNFNYDGAGRLYSVTPPTFTDNGSSTSCLPTTFTYAPTQVAVYVLGNGVQETTTYLFDGFGNLASKRTKLDTSHTIYEDTSVDSLGRVTDRFIPCFSASTRGRVTTAYDALGRPVTVTAKKANLAIESSTSYAYSSDPSHGYVHVTITRPKSDDSGTVDTDEYYDADGNLRKLTDSAGNTTAYSYDGLGHVTEIDQGSQTRIFSYANTGQLLSSQLPETGNTATTFTYDKMGNLKKRVFPDGGTIQYTPDFAGRVTQILFDDGAKIVNSYDQYPGGTCSGGSYASNHLVYQAVKDPSGTVLRSICNFYDSHGRLYLQNHTLDNTIFALKYDYNNRGELTQITYPSGGKAVVSSLNNAGLPATITDGTTAILSSIQYGPDRKPISYTAGSTAWSRTPDNFNRTQAVALGALYRSDLAYYPSGSLKSQSFGDTNGLGTEGVTYDYDNLHRLTGQTYSGALTGSLDYGYDLYGNFKTRTASGIPNAQALAFSKSYSAATNHDTSATYDSRGNALQDGLFSCTVNAFNMAATASKGTTSYAYSYGADGKRVRSSWQDGQGNNHVLYQFYGGAGELLSEMESVNGGAITPKRDYIYTSGQLVASLDASPATSQCGASFAGYYRQEGAAREGQAASAGSRPWETFWAGAWDTFVPNTNPSEYEAPLERGSRAEAAAGVYEYPVLDVTGTPRIWVDGAGNVLSRNLSGAYGEDLGIFHDQNFTGVGFASMADEHQTVGAIYTPNRFLGTAGHFYAVDPSGTFSVHDPRTLNQYAYAGQNPLLITDPSGLAWAEDFADWVDSKLDRAVGLYSNTNASAVDYFVVSSLVDAVKIGTDTFRLGQGAVASYDAASRGEYLEATGAALQDLGRASNIVLVGGIAGRMFQAASKGSEVGSLLETRVSDLAHTVSSGPSWLRGLPTADELKLSGTVAKHLGEVSKAGIPTRPFLESPLTIQEIMATKPPIPDPGGVPGALRWDVPGELRGASGAWELVVDPNTKTIIHFNFVRLKP